MKRTNVIYWILTGLLALLILPGAVMNMLSTKESVEIFQHINFPKYMIPFLGTAKVLGIIAILIPGYPRIKEWAYAGLFYDLLGAGYAGFSSGDSFIRLIGIIVGLSMIMGSYLLYHKRLKAQ